MSGKRVRRRRPLMWRRAPLRSRAALAERSTAFSLMAKPDLAAAAAAALPLPLPTAPAAVPARGSRDAGGAAAPPFEVRPPPATTAQPVQGRDGPAVQHQLDQQPPPHAKAGSQQSQTAMSTDLQPEHAHGLEEGYLHPSAALQPPPAQVLSREGGERGIPPGSSAPQLRASHRPSSADEAAAVVVAAPNEVTPVAAAALPRHAAGPRPQAIPVTSFPVTSCDELMLGCASNAVRAAAPELLPNLPQPKHILRWRFGNISENLHASVSHLAPCASPPLHSTSDMCLRPLPSSLTPDPQRMPGACAVCRAATLCSILRRPRCAT